MTGRSYLIAGAMLGAVLLGACDQTPVTGRTRITPVADRELAQQAAQLYAEELRKNPLSHNAAQLAMVRRVGQRIARAAETPPDEKWPAPNYQWEFNLIDKPDVINAYCLPGGKIAVYSGIFRIAPDEESLAAIMGHEVAHALLRHHGERIAQQQTIGAGAAAVGAVLGVRNERSVIGSALGVASNTLILSFGRGQELEADRVGMILAAHAGYDPRAAIGVWERMAEAQRGRGRQPEFLSTHPTERSRIREIEMYLPEAQQYYKAGR